jgi:thiol-disulfide isomerase/thioredoxin
MLSISIGPLSLPLAPLLLLLALWAASLLASRIARRVAAGDTNDQAARDRAAAAGNVMFHAALFGLLAARIAFVAPNAGAYLDSPWSMLDVRDGGWSAPVGFAAGASWLAWRATPMPALRRALAGGATAGAALWLATSVATGLHGAHALPDVGVTELHGGAQVTLAQAARGRPLVVNLWASWCGPCRQEMPMLAAAQQRETSVGFLFVNQGESRSAVQAYLTDQGLPLREVLLDPGSALMRAVGSRGMPTTLFYDALGRLVVAQVGVRNAAALEVRLPRLRSTP